MRAAITALALTLAVPAIAQTAAPAASDAARLAVAERVVAALVPDGIYARMMRDQFPAMMDAMMAQMMGMTPAELGIKSKSGQSLGETASQVDPAFQERMKISTRVMSQELGTVMSKMEPRVRNGLGRAFARKFTAQQLDDMNAFFKTPSGKAFADQYLLLFADPEMTREMAAAVPEMMEAMPAIIKKVEDATKHLPPLPKPQADTQTEHTEQ